MPLVSAMRNRTRMMYRGYDASTGTEALFTDKKIFDEFMKRNETHIKPMPPIIESKCPCCHQWRRVRKQRVLKKSKFIMGERP